MMEEKVGVRGCHSEVSGNEKLDFARTSKPKTGKWGRNLVNFGK